MKTSWIDAIAARLAIPSAILLSVLWAAACHDSSPRSGDGDLDEVEAGDPSVDPAVDPTVDEAVDPGPDVDCDVMQCFDCYCDCGPNCGGCFSLCDEVPISVLTCTCCSPCPDATDVVVDPSDVTPDLPPDVPPDWPTEVPVDWLEDTAAGCVAAAGFCSGARWNLCPAGYEPKDPDPHGGCDMEGWCCVPAPWSPCSASGEANCVAAASCTGCWDDAPGGLSCEAGRVCCVDMCW